MPDLITEYQNIASYPGWTVTFTPPEHLRLCEATLVFGETEQEWPESISSPDPLAQSILYL